jgi:hypothetical protein
MIPAANAGPMTIVALYMVVSIGILTGAQVGYHADSRAGAEMAFDRESDELTIGTETIDIYNESESNITLGATADGELRSDGGNPMLSERGERWIGSDSEPPVAVDGSHIERYTPDMVEEAAGYSVNATLAFGFETVALVGDQTAAITYRYQDRVSWSTVYILVTVLVWSPLLGAGYYFYRKVTG